MAADPKNQHPLNAESAASGRPRTANTAAMSAPSASKAHMQKSMGRINGSNCPGSAELHAPLAERRTPTANAREKNAPVSKAARPSPPVRPAQSSARAGIAGRMYGISFESEKEKKTSTNTHQIHSNRAASNRPRGTRSLGTTANARAAWGNHDTIPTTSTGAKNHQGSVRCSIAVANRRKCSRTKKNCRNSALARAASTNQGAAIAANNGSPQRRFNRRSSIQSRCHARYANIVAPGITTPINPLVSTASAMAAQQPNIHARQWLAVSRRACAAKKQPKAASSQKLNIMSRVSWCPSSTNKADAEVYSTARSPASNPHRSRPRKNTVSSTRYPASPVHSRAGTSLCPRPRNASAVSQYCSGGFSKYTSPLRRGITQSPLLNISRGISAYRPSSGSNSGLCARRANHSTVQKSAAAPSIHDLRSMIIGPPTN